MYMMSSTGTQFRFTVWNFSLSRLSSNKRLIYFFLLGGFLPPPTPTPPQLKLNVSSDAYLHCSLGDEDQVETHEPYLAVF